MPSLEDGAKEAAIVAAITGEEVRALARIGGGRNSRVFRAEGASGRRWAAKFYFTHDSDRRDRLKTEFEGLGFLWERGVRQIPRPVGRDRSAVCGVYEFLDGRTFPPETAGEAEVDAALDFLDALRRLAPEGIAAALDPASEACFSLEALADNLSARLKRVESSRGDGASYRDMRAFVCDELKPDLDAFLSRARTLLLDDRPLAPESRTLSPSDFGFHNALRCPDGIRFLDFEYFGLDDPAKTLSDFILHPGMRLADGLRARFRTGMLKRFGGGLKERFAALFPLYAAKWCLILLNEFTKEDRLRRDFSNGASASGEDARRLQLKKARVMLGLGREGSK